MTEDRSKRRFLSVVFTVLSFGKPLLIRLMMVMGIYSIYICIQDKEWLLSLAKIELGWLSEGHLSLGNAVCSENVYFYTFTTSPESVSWPVCKGVVIIYWGGWTNSGEGLKTFKPRLGKGQNVFRPTTVHRRVVQAGCVIAYKECRWCSTT